MQSNHGRPQITEFALEQLIRERRITETIGPDKELVISIGSGDSAQFNRIDEPNQCGLIPFVGFYTRSEALHFDVSVVNGTEIIFLFKEDDKEIIADFTIDYIDSKFCFVEK